MNKLREQMPENKLQRTCIFERSVESNRHPPKSSPVFLPRESTTMKLEDFDHVVGFLQHLLLLLSMLRDFLRNKH
jgi:hypothetical protein